MAENANKEESMFVKFGGDEKVKILVYKIFDAIESIPELAPFSKKRNNELLNAKICEYFKYLLGGSKFWFGKSMKEAHKHLKMKEEHFDIFYKLFIT